MNQPKDSFHEMTMPQSIEAEMGMLGSMLLDARAIDEFSDIPEEAFYKPAHRVILETIRDMRGRGEATDFITITAALETKGVLQDVGGAAGLTDLFTYVPTASNVKFYAGIVRSKWLRRRVILMSTDQARLAYEVGEDDNEVLISECERMALELRSLAEPKSENAVQHCKAATMEALDYLEVAYSKRGGTLGLATGIVDLDRMTFGLQGGQMITIAARPSKGKTALGMQIAEYIVMNAKVPTLVDTMEMTRRDLLLRAICGHAEINLQRVRDGYLGKADWPKIVRVADQLAISPLYLDDTPALTTAQFRARARRAKARHNIGLIVVDYMQLMQGSSKRAKENRQQEVAEISGTIKAVAKELNIPIIALAQLGRDVEQRGKNARPKLSDLRESGSIEQDSDLVMFIHQLDPPDPDKEMSAKELEEQAKRGNCELIVAKQRNGPVGTINLKFVPKFTQFQNITEAFASNDPEKRQQNR